MTGWHLSKRGHLPHGPGSIQATDSQGAILYLCDMEHLFTFDPCHLTSLMQDPMPGTLARVKPRWLFLELPCVRRGEYKWCKFLSDHLGTAWGREPRRRHLPFSLPSCRSCFSLSSLKAQEGLAVGVSDFRPVPSGLDASQVLSCFMGIKLIILLGQSLQAKASGWWHLTSCQAPSWAPRWLVPQHYKNSFSFCFVF